MTTKRPADARRQRMWMARAAELLAGARGADDQDAAVGRRDLLDRSGAAGSSPASGRPASIGAGANCLSSFTSRLSREVSSARSATSTRPVGLERLLDEVVGAALDRGDRRLDVAVARDHHDRQFGMDPLCSESSSCRPSSRLPCSQMSRNTRFGRRFAIAFRARRRCRAPCACHSLRPARMPATSSRISASSSTMRMSDGHARCQRCRLIEVSASTSRPRASLRLAAGSRGKAQPHPGARAGRDLLRRRRAARCRRRGPRGSARRWQDRGPCPSRASVT